MVRRVDAILEGQWQMVRAEQAGDAAPDYFVARTELRFAGGAYEVWFGGERSDRGTYREEAATGGARGLELRGAEGPNAGRTLRCIFQLMGDRLRICYGLDGVRPAVFATQAGDQRYLATYRRVSSGAASG
jgi:uncharacterized protein (TIGR03067 family)